MHIHCRSPHSSILTSSSYTQLLTLSFFFFLIFRLREAGFKLKFCTNETVVTKKHLVEKLQGLGFNLRESEVHSPAPACIAYLKEKKLRPLLLGEYLLIETCTWLLAKYRVNWFSVVTRPAYLTANETFLLFTQKTKEAAVGEIPWGSPSDI